MNSHMKRGSRVRSRRDLVMGASIPVELRCTTLLAHKCTHQLEVPQSLYLWDSQVTSSMWASVNHELNSPPHCSLWMMGREPESSKILVVLIFLATSLHTGGHPESPHPDQKDTLVTQEFEPGTRGREQIYIFIIMSHY